MVSELLAKKRILLLGSYGRGNLGDDMYLKIILKYLYSHNVHFNCHRLSNLPDDIDIRSNHSAISTSFLRDLSEKIAIFLKTDIIIYGGGELWMLLQGVKIPTLSLIKMLFVNAGARLLGKKVYYISVGAEELKGISLLIAKLSARLSNYIIFRDNRSPTILKLNPKKYKVLPDLITTTDSVIAADAKMPPYLGLNAVAEVDSKYPYEEYVRALITLVSEYKLTILPIPAMDTIVDPHNDMGAINTITSYVENDVVKNGYKSIEHTIKCIASVKLLVSSRLHICLLGILCGTPTIGYAYKSKVSKLFNALNIPEYCLNPGEVINEDLKDVRKIKKAQAAATKQLQLEAIRTKRHYRILMQQFVG